MGKSVLVVEDEPNIALSLRFLMGKLGLDVRVAENGDAALKACSEQKPDLILLDLMLPERDGYDVCREIRSNPAWQDIRIIMLTAKGRDADREKGMALGADDYITKPFSTRDLVSRVENFFAGEAVGSEPLAGDGDVGR